MLFELSQYSDLSFFALRLAVAVIFAYHALPKLKNSAAMGQAMAMPGGMVLMLGAVEFTSALGMALGLYVQLAALLLAFVMVGATYFKMVKWHMPFSAMDKTGWEFDMILLAANLFLLVNGGGAIGI